jgi:hypothetical protein
MQEMVSTQSGISEVLTDLNMTNNPSPRRTNTTAPEIAVTWPGADSYRAIGFSVG